MEYKGSKLSQNLSSLCEDCGLTFNDEEEFNTHRKNSNCLVLLGWPPCNKCGLVLAVLQEHMFREVSTLSCICGKCGKLYLTEQEVKDHMDSDHTTNATYVCSTFDAMTVHKGCPSPSQNSMY